MIKGKTSSGFEFEVNEGLKHDYRLIKLLMKSQSNKATDAEKINATVDLVTLVLGDKEDEFIEHVAEHNGGIADVASVGREVGEIIRASGEADEETKK